MLMGYNRQLHSAMKVILKPQSLQEARASPEVMVILQRALKILLCSMEWRGQALLRARTMGQDPSLPESICL